MNKAQKGKGTEGVPAASAVEPGAKGARSEAPRGEPALPRGKERRHVQIEKCLSMPIFYLFYFYITFLLQTRVNIKAK